MIDLNQFDGHAEQAQNKSMVMVYRYNNGMEDCPDLLAECKRQAEMIRELKAILIVFAAKL